MQRGIDQLVSAEVDQPPFHRKIAQIEFNAWQYVEGNLWASLLEHLFRNLRRAGEEDADDLLEARLHEYLTQITERTAGPSRNATSRPTSCSRALTSTGETVRRAGPVRGPLRTGRWRYALVLIVVIGLGSLISFGLSLTDVSAVSNVITSVSVFLGGVTAYAAYGNKALADILGELSQVQAKLNVELDDQRE